MSSEFPIDLPIDISLSYEVQTAFREKKMEKKKGDNVILFDH